MGKTQLTTGERYHWRTILLANDTTGERYHWRTSAARGRMVKRVTVVTGAFVVAALLLSQVVLGTRMGDDEESAKISKLKSLHKELCHSTLYSGACYQLFLETHKGEERKYHQNPKIGKRFKLEEGKSLDPLHMKTLPERVEMECDGTWDKVQDKRDHLVMNALEQYTKFLKAQPQKQAQVRTVATEVKTAVKPKARVVTPKTATKHAAKLQQLSTAKTPTVQPAPVITDKEKAAAHSQHNAQTKPVVVQKFLKKVVGAQAVEKSVHNDAQEIVMEPDYQAATAVVEGLPTKRPALPLLPPLKKAEAATTHNAKHPATVHKAKKPVAMPPVSQVVSPASVDSGHNLAWYLIWGTVASLCLGI